MNKIKSLLKFYSDSRQTVIDERQAFLKSYSGHQDLSCSLKPFISCHCYKVSFGKQTSNLVLCIIQMGWIMTIMFLFRFFALKFLYGLSFYTDRSSEL